MSKFTKSAPDLILSEETALQQVQTFCEFYGIDPDSKEKDAGEATESLLDKLLLYVRRGWVEIKDDLSVVQHLQTPPGEVKLVTYRKVTGADAVTAGKGGADWQAKLWALLGATADVGEAVKKLTGKDLTVAEVLGALFFSR